MIHEDEPEPVAQPEAEDKKARTSRERERHLSTVCRCYAATLRMLPKEKPEKSGDIKKPETSPKKALRKSHQRVLPAPSLVRLLHRLMRSAALAALAAAP